MNLMQDLFDILKKRKRFILLMVVLPTLVAFVLNILTARQYFSKTSILPANSRFSDKSRFTAEEITELYSVFSSGDDLDRLFATVRSYPVMMKMVDSFDLVKHYRIKKTDERGREAALKEFHEQCGIFKTEYGEIHIKVWDRDRILAADIANAMVAQTEKAHQQLYRDYYSTSLEKLERAYATLLDSEKDVMAKDTARISGSIAYKQLDYYRRAMTDLRMALLNPPAALMVLERAIPSVKPDRPKVLVNVVATFLVSLFTAVAAALLLPAFNKKS